MTGADDLRAALDAVPVVAILRASTGTHLDAVVDTLVAAGVRALEITLPTPGSAATIASAVARHGARVAVGAGTVLDVTEVGLAAGAGAAFVVSPGTRAAVITAATARGMASLPGAMTPTEICTARDAGAELVKLFPARTLGPAYVRDVLAPLPTARLVPVGGVGIDDVEDYLRAGAVAVGVGSPLVGDALEGGSLEDLGVWAERYVEVARARAR